MIHHLLVVVGIKKSLCDNIAGYYNTGINWTFEVFD